MNKFHILFPLAKRRVLVDETDCYIFNICLYDLTLHAHLLLM